MAFINLRPAYDSPLGVPLFKAPYGRVTAIDLNTGEHAWMVPNGDPPEYLKAVPALKGVDISKFGNPERAPLLVTKTLLFSGDGGGRFGAPKGGGGPMMRALNKRTGAKIWEMKLPANETGIPMTYMLNGRQYIAVAIGAADFPAEMITLTLPPPGR
jgi:quinoprotein glucose dehydrogenase